MFPYDPALAVAVQVVPHSIADVVRIMEAIDSTCAEGDGLKWFNWLYLNVTKAVEARVNGGGFIDPTWLAELDVQFARLYFNALGAWLAGSPCPGCWAVMFGSRDQGQVARIQFALAGMNAHINHDLAEAIVITCKLTAQAPKHGTAQYNDYTTLNTTLDSLIETAKKVLHVRLLGTALPPVSRLEDTIAAWNVKAAREQAWINSELLWHLEAVPELADGFMNSLDGLTTVAGKTLMVPVP